MWCSYTGAIAAACVVGLAWLAVATRKSHGAASAFPILIALPLLVGAIILGITSLIAYGDYATGVRDALTQLPTSVVLLHRALHVALGAALAGVGWLLWQIFH